MGNGYKRALAPAIPQTIRPNVDIYVGDKEHDPAQMLVSQVARLADRDAVRRFLPDILGRALARIWIDTEFQARFAADPKATLEEHGVYLPESILVDYSDALQARPCIIVYELSRDGATKTRLMYLQLVMVAAK